MSSNTREEGSGPDLPHEPLDDAGETDLALSLRSVQPSIALALSLTLGAGRDESSSAADPNVAGFPNTTSSSFSAEGEGSHIHEAWYRARGVTAFVAPSFPLEIPREERDGTERRAAAGVVVTISGGLLDATSSASATG